MGKNKNWKGSTFGNNWMHKWLIIMLRYINVRVLYVFEYVFIVPVCVIVNKSGGVIYRYFRERFAYGTLKAIWLTYVNHCRFGETVIDKFAFYAGKKFSVSVEGYEYFKSLALKDEGFIQLSAHVGNYEMAGYSLNAKNKILNALVFSKEKESVMNNRNKMFSKTNIRMIPVTDDGSHVYLINNALGRGEIVSMPADRNLGSTRVLKRKILGAEASIPLGPFSIATMRGLDVLQVNVMKVGYKSYKAYVTPLKYDKNADRKTQIEQLSTAYANELSRILQMHPVQWYNYFDFWNC